MTYLITGATGDVGARVVDSLLALGERPRVFVRDETKARSRFGDRVEVFLGDLADPLSLKNGLQGVDALFLVTTGPRIPDLDDGAAKAAKAAGVRQLVKLSSLDVEPAVIDHLILLRPEDDLNLSGKSKTLWQEAEKRGRHARLEAVSLDAFAALYAFPRFLAALGETLPAGQPLPNLADLLQDRCEKLLEQVCMPVQGG